jgi:hypothetical protein
MGQAAKSGVEGNNTLDCWGWESEGPIVVKRAGESRKEPRGPGVRQADSEGHGTD